MKKFLLCRVSLAVEQLLKSKIPRITFAFRVIKRLGRNLAEERLFRTIPLRNSWQFLNYRENILIKALLILKQNQKTTKYKRCIEAEMMNINSSIIRKRILKSV